MWESSESQRRQLENKIISRYKPICNKFDESDQDVFSTTVKTTRPEPEPEPEPED